MAATSWKEWSLAHHSTYWRADGGAKIGQKGNASDWSNSTTSDVGNANGRTSTETKPLNVTVKLWKRIA